eukprot:TRINITY_DN19044_c0_g1_i1.p1 TRINITY_DN19044_c0_g1~~TRINITY_DN19044_c0_g1_i1.p1  ORF type:complete len:167 (+),score=11.15 TRINITY_DN19044_c0_g1_i1:54-503(+)
MADEDTNFDCGICMDKATEPVVTQCGHLFCWPCLGRWLDREHSDCPTCKAGCTRDNIIPLYGKGRSRGSGSSGLPEPSEERPRANRPPTPPRRPQFPQFNFTFDWFSFPVLPQVFPGMQPEQPLGWNDETKSALSLYIGLVVLLYLIIV